MKSLRHLGAKLRGQAPPRTILATLALIVLILLIAISGLVAVDALAGWAVACLVLIGLGIAMIAIGSNHRSSDLQTSGVRASILTDSGVALATGAIVGVIILGATWQLERTLVDTQSDIDDQRETRQIQLENLRFVRSIASQADSPTKPFAHMDLRGMDLNGLDLSDADLRHADLRGASLVDAELNCAWMSGALLADADLGGARLTRVDLTGADLTDARFVGRHALRVDDEHELTLIGVPTDLTSAILDDASLRGTTGAVLLGGASLNGTDLDGSDLIFAYDSDTKWPSDTALPPKATEYERPADPEPEPCPHEVPDLSFQELIDSVPD